MKVSAAAALVVVSLNFGIGKSSENVPQLNLTECSVESIDHMCSEVSSGNGDLNGQGRNESAECSGKPGSGCADSHELCAQWAQNGECGRNQEYMLHYCMKSCAVCGEHVTDNPVDEEPCVDMHPSCSNWKYFNECEKSPVYMLTNCRKSCKACATSITSTIDFGVKQKEGGENASQVRAVIRDSKKYMQKIMSDPLYASVRETCRNGNELCSLWAAAGECQRNPITKLQCAPACQTCDMLNLEQRCPMPVDDAEDALKPGDLNKMFERIIDRSEGSPYAKYNATIISRPYKSGDKSARTWALGPWFVSFDNFLSDEESDRLISYGEQKGFGQSEQVSKTQKPDGSYEIVANSHRTSHNTWCDETCQSDPLIRGVIERIAEVTGIPEQNSENLQILRYEKGQHYAEHADYIPYQKERPCGVRILTFFFYMNDDFEGGETKFRFLHDMRIKPKKGKAILWPNVLDKNPNEEDELLDHEAMAVTKGMKYAANAWLHMRDYKGSLKMRCV